MGPKTLDEYTWGERTGSDTAHPFLRHVRVELDKLRGWWDALVENDANTPHFARKYERMREQILRGVTFEVAVAPRRRRRRSTTKKRTNAAECCTRGHTVMTLGEIYKDLKPELRPDFDKAMDIVEEVRAFGARYSDTDLDRFAELAFKATMVDIKRKNRPSEAQEIVTRGTCRLLVNHLAHRVEGRYVISSPCGVGKTTAIKHVLAVLDRETDLVGLTLQVEIRAGQRLIEQLAGLGVAAEHIGHVHSKPGGKVASEVQRTRWAFATQTRAGLANASTAVRYRWRTDGEESVILRPVIVDEGISAGWGEGWHLRDLQMAARHLKIGVGPEAVQWVRATLEAIEELSAGYGPAELPIELAMPATDTERKAILGQLRQNRKLHDFAAPYVTILESGGRNDRFRLLRKVKGRELLQHRRVLSEDYHNVIVFDGGAEEDALRKLDDGIQLAHVAFPELLPIRPGSIKSFETMEVHHLVAQGGNDYMYYQFAKDGDDPHHVVTQKVVEWLGTKATPFLQRLPEANRKVLLCFHKDALVGAVRIMRALDREWAAAGIPWKSSDDVNGTPRVQATWWGNHTSENQWQDVGAVLAVGTKILPQPTARAKVLGQVNDPAAPAPSGEQVTAVLENLSALDLYQLAGRGRSRQMDLGVAKAQIFGFVHHSKLVRPYLQGLLPGAVWVPWDEVQSREEEAARTIRDYLKSQEQPGVTLSGKAIRAALASELADLTPPSFSRALSAAIEGTDWVRPPGSRGVAYEPVFDVVEGGFVSGCPAPSRAG